MAKPKRTMRVVLSVLLCGGLLAVAPTAYSLVSSQGRAGSVATVDAQPVAIVFGAATYSDGTPSPFLAARLDLAKQLYSAGKVRAILVSGDNRRADYNEPDAMRGYLIKAGVPAAKVVADYAGFDTYATCVRAKKIFGASAAILATQSYHLPRAITTCRAVGVDAWGVGDDSAQRNADQWWLGWLREGGANIKMALDLVSSRQPVLGKPETSLTRALER
jgi:vancomycin permeability regulator SanA